MATTPERQRRRISLPTLAVVALIHLAAIYALINAFAPGVTASVERSISAVFTVVITTPPPPPPPFPPAVPEQSPQKAGVAAPAGPKADARTVVAPPIELSSTSSPPAPPVSSIGNTDVAGASSAGSGTGAGGNGAGTGSGTRGDGDGGGGVAVARPVKTAGDIRSTRDYPKATRDLRLGSDVTISMVVGTDGRARNCKVVKPSRDPEGDRITCALALARFRFDPATDANGRPVAALYGWNQRWFR